jgi:(p)ppGpp synthase/HD superfamily hydrolase
MAALTHRFTRALDYARQTHGAQTRKGGEVTYLAHLLGVAALVLEHGGDEDQAIAGLLYNVIRDCGPTHAQQISDAFGPTVADIVVECSDGAAEDTSGTGAGWQQLLDWQRRKLAHLAHLATATDATLLVSGCSKLCNARAIVGDLDDPRVGKTVFARFKSGLDGTLAYYHSLSQVFIKRGSPVARQLDAVVVRMHVLAGVGERRGLEMN